MFSDLKQRFQAVRATLKTPQDWSIEMLAYKLTGNLDVNLERSARISLGTRISRLPGIERKRTGKERFWRVYPLLEGEKAS